MDESMFRGFVQEIGGVWEEVTLGEIFDMFDEDLVAAMRTCSAVTDEGEVRALSSLQRGHVRKGLQRLAELAGRTPQAWGGSAPAVKAPPAAPPTRGQVPQQVVVTPTMHEFSTTIEQGRRTMFQELPAEQVRTMCEAYVDKWGTPRDYEDCTTLQLSALAAKLALDEAPSVDFAVWGPFGKRIQKLLYFSSDVFVNGEYVKRRILGPSNFEGFRKAWQVFRTAALKLDVTKAGPVDSYVEGVRQLATLFPKDWGAIYTVVSHNMEERWDQLRAKMERAVRDGKPPEGWDPRRPWQAVLMASAYNEGSDSQWWRSHLELPCLTSSSPAGVAATVAALEGASQDLPLAPPPGTAQRSTGAGPAAPPIGKQPPWVRAKPEPSNKSARKADKYKEKVKSWEEAGQRADGRYVSDGKGVALCYAWNRKEGGCAEPCSANPRRRHLCEWCRGPHRAIDDSCPAARRPPGWRPPTGKGAGR